MTDIGSSHTSVTTQARIRLPSAPAPALSRGANPRAQGASPLQVIETAVFDMATDVPGLDIADKATQASQCAAFLSDRDPGGYDVSQCAAGSVTWQACRRACLAAFSASHPSPCARRGCIIAR